MSEMKKMCTTMMMMMMMERKSIVGQTKAGVVGC
jgi:hypothetical protein